MLDLPNNQMRSELLSSREIEDLRLRRPSNSPGPHSKQEEAEPGLTLGLSFLAGEGAPCTFPRCLSSAIPPGFRLHPTLFWVVLGSHGPRGGPGELDRKLSRSWRILTPCPCTPESGLLRGWCSDSLGDICSLAEVGPLGPTLACQRAPAVAQVRVRGGEAPFLASRGTRGGSQVWKHNPSWVPSPALVSAQGLSDLAPSFLLCLGESDFLSAGVRKPGVSPCDLLPAPASVTPLTDAQARSPFPCPHSRPQCRRCQAPDCLPCHLPVSSQPRVGVWACSGSYYQDRERRRGSAWGTQPASGPTGARAPWKGRRNQGPVWAG